MNYLLLSFIQDKLSKKFFLFPSFSQKEGTGGGYSSSKKHDIFSLVLEDPEGKLGSSEEEGTEEKYEGSHRKGRYRIWGYGGMADATDLKSVGFYRP